MTPMGDGAQKVIVGFADGTLGLGILLPVVWIAAWAIGEMGGPQIQMPLQLLETSGLLVLSGLMLRFLVKAAAQETDRELKD